MKTRLVLSFLLAIFFIHANVYSKSESQDKKPLDVKTLLGFKFISDIQVAPNGIYGAYVVSEKNYEINSTTRNIWLFSVYGNEPKRMTYSERANHSPRWGYDGRTLGFISNRSGGSQIWLMDIKGGEPRKLTDFAAGIDDFIFSPDKKHILFTSTVYKECSDDKCVRERDKKIENSKLKARIITDRLYRHWNSWLEDKISRLFLLNIDSGAVEIISPKGLSVPPVALGGIHDFTFSPDGKEIAFSTNTDEDLSHSTNNDIYIHNLKEGNSTLLTTNPANDSSPSYSADGKYIAYLTQATPGYESDKINLAIYDRATGKHSILTEKLARWVHEYVWAPDSKTIYLAADDFGYHEIYSASIVDKAIKKMTIKTYNKNLRVALNGKQLVMLRESFNSPPEIYTKDLVSGKIAKLTSHNDELLKDVRMGKWEEFTFKSTDGTNIHGFMLFPPLFNPKRKYPLVVLIHGGPQGVWSNSFHPRWNTQMFVSPGYVAAAINFRGSTGYGQDFTAQISKNWTGQAYKDIMAGVDWLLANQKFLDKRKMCAAGGSFGGYVVNWIEANSNRFKCLVSHAGPSDLLSQYGTTEEKWFPEWDIGGTPYDNFKTYKKNSPIFYAKKFKTPILILHGENDFRVPLEQALEMYTAAKYAGIDSKMVLFPEESHWIAKPRNAELWWNTIHEWFAKHLK